jgi:pilus assembly protein CpaF
MITAGSITAGAAQLLRRMVHGRLAFLVSGGTGSGKTTLLSALLGEVPSTERLLIIEDSRELAPDHPHLVRLEARQGNAESAGAVTLTNLVRQALRMRPDRLVIGEVRGAEISDLLMALNTGHEGGCGTVHANSARDVPARLEALGALGGLGRNALHAQLAAALDSVVHIVRDESGRRWVSEISVFRRRADGLVEAGQAVDFKLDGTTRLGPACRRLESLLDR